MTRPVIFLDVDGVLNGRKHIVKATNRKRGWEFFDPDCVKVLNEIVHRLDANVCIIAAMRILFPLEDLGRWLEEVGLVEGAERTIDATESLGNRELEIERWLERNPAVERIVVLDDEHIGIGKFSKLAIKTYFWDEQSPWGKGGLHMSQVDEAVEIGVKLWRDVLG